MWMFNLKFTLSPQHEKKERKKKNRILQLGFLAIYRKQTFFIAQTA